MAYVGSADILGLTVSRPGGRGMATTVSRKVGTPTGTVLARCQVGAT